jgi:enoyl-CoA hydratase/carnithine racemase
VTVHYDTDGPVVVVTIDRPEVANAVDRPTADTGEMGAGLDDYASGGWRQHR